MGPSSELWSRSSWRLGWEMPLWYQQPWLLWCCSPWAVLLSTVTAGAVDHILYWAQVSVRHWTKSLFPRLNLQHITYRIISLVVFLPHDCQNWFCIWWTRVFQNRVFLVWKNKVGSVLCVTLLDELPVNPHLLHSRRILQNFCFQWITSTCPKLGNVFSLTSPFLINLFYYMLLNMSSL